MYAIFFVQVDVNKHNDVTKCPSNVITVWQTSAIKVTALLKIHVQKWMGMYYVKKASIIGVKGNSVKLSLPPFRKVVHSRRNKFAQFILKPLKRQSQLLSSALSSASHFKSHFCKQCGPRSDCSSRSSLIWVHTVCLYAKVWKVCKNIQQKT